MENTQITYILVKSGLIAGYYKIIQKFNEKLDEKDGGTISW